MAEVTEALVVALLTRALCLLPGAGPWETGANVEDGEDGAPGEREGDVEAAEEGMFGPL